MKKRDPGVFGASPLRVRRAGFPGSVNREGEPVGIQGEGDIPGAWLKLSLSGGSIGARETLVCLFSPELGPRWQFCVGLLVGRCLGALGIYPSRAPTAADQVHA